MLELILNPTAGNGKAKEISQTVTAYLKQKGVPFSLHETTKPGHATQLAKEAVARGAETVAALGGDGTLREVASGLFGTKTALGIIPCGTGNDYIKAAGIPLDPINAVDFMLSHKARPVDTGMVNGLPFLNVCGTGFDIIVLDYALKAKKYVKGILPYLYGVLRTLLHYEVPAMHITIGDSIVLDGKYLVCAIGNGRFFGGGMPIAPDAKLDDGVFDIFVMEDPPHWQTFVYLPALLRGTLKKKKRAHIYRASKCSFTSENMRVDVDGEILPMKTAEFTCHTDLLLLHW